MEENDSENTEFLRLFSSASKDLKNVADEIKEQARLFKLYKESRINYFSRDSNGKLKFFIPDGKNPDVNLLEKFSSHEELGKHIAGLETDWNPQILDAKTKKDLPDRYWGPKIRLFKDTNVLLHPETDSSPAAAARRPYIVQEVFTIVQHECRPGGIVRTFGCRVPKDIARGQASLEKRCEGIRQETRQELSLMYDIFHSLFEKEVSEITSYYKNNGFQSRSARDIAQSFADNERRDYSPAYSETVAKIIEKCRQGEEHNFIADRVLTAAAFCFNLVNERDRAVAVSNDVDLINMFDFFYNRVIPAYMAKTTIAAMKERNPAFLRLPGYEKRTIDAAREQIKWARETFDDNPLAVGILYVPKDKRFYVKEVAAPLKKYFNKVALFRMGKIELISRMVTGGKSAAETVQTLMQEDEQKLFS